MNKGRYSRIGISPFWFTASWTCRLSGRSPPSAYWVSHGVRQENKCGYHLCDASYSYIRCSSSLSPLRRFLRGCLPVPPHQFLHYWYNCRCREHTRVRLYLLPCLSSGAFGLVWRAKQEGVPTFASSTIPAPCQWRIAALIHFFPISVVNPLFS